MSERTLKKRKPPENGRTEKKIRRETVTDQMPNNEERNEIKKKKTKRKVEQ